MNIIITMGGLGTRLRQAGYTIPKYMIQAKEKTLFEWSLDSLRGYETITEQYIFVVRSQDHAKPFIMQQCKKRGLDCVRIIEIEELTDGQASTAMIGITHADAQTPVMIYNIDTYVEPYILRAEDIRGDGYLPCFTAPGDHWSFVRTDRNGRAVEIQEKKRISDYCTLGAYYFASAQLYQQIYNEYYAAGPVQETEKYVAPLYNCMIQNGMEVRISMVPQETVHVLGTPEELACFCGESGEKQCRI